MDTDRLLAEQVAFFRGRAGQADDWWEGRFEDDLSEPFRTAWRADAEQLRKALEAFAPHGEVLELAAGTGVFTGELLRHGAQVTAVDAAPEALAINRARHGSDRVSYIEADLFAWVPPRRFDAVCFSFWISHVPTERWAGFWALVDQALVPGGRVWFCDNAHPDHATAHGPAAARGHLGSVDRDQEHQERRLPDGRSFQTVKRYWQPAELADDLAGLGWQATVRTTGWAFLYGMVTRAGDVSSAGSGQSDLADR